MSIEKISKLLAMCDDNWENLSYSKKKFVEWVKEALADGLTLTPRECEKLEAIAYG